MEAKKSFGLQWHITERCDQRCKHCYIYAGKELEILPDMSIDKMKKILLDFLNFCEKMNRNPSISVTGGDPILYKHFWEFIDLLKINNVNFSILGNPFHLNDEVADRLKQSGCKAYQMSIDGLEETHDFIRKPGSYKATMQKIRCLKKAGITATIMTTVSKTNISEIPQLVDEMVKYKVDRFAFARYCPNPGDFELMPTPEEYKSFMEKMWNKYEEYSDSSTFFSLKDHLWKLFLYEKGYFDISNISNPENLILDGCHCGISHMTLLTDGTVYACRRSYTPVGKVPQQSFLEIFWGNEMEKYRQYEKFEKCSKCELLNYCRGCPSVANCLNGSFYSSDPQCWKK